MSRGRQTRRQLVVFRTPKVIGSSVPKAAERGTFNNFFPVDALLLGYTVAWGLLVPKTRSQAVFKPLVRPDANGSRTLLALVSEASSLRHGLDARDNGHKLQGQNPISPRSRGGLTLQWWKLFKLL